ncbi:MAG TPA: hypothetical protein VFA28_03895 [Bryobacteraceae bacterium]|nr:hypothetical protein [Bryobacteraceae bacterium]
MRNWTATAAALLGIAMHEAPDPHPERWSKLTRRGNVFAGH